MEVRDIRPEENSSAENGKSLYQGGARTEDRYELVARVK
jgi:hypothetical protein